jgi:hypothetical protein
LTKKEYTYSLLNNKVEYQLKTNFEEATSKLPINNTFASNNNYKIK